MPVFLITSKSEKFIHEGRFRQIFLKIGRQIPPEVQ